MSHFAKIENGTVTEVIVAEQNYIDTIAGQWVQTSYNTWENQHPQNTPLRGNFAGVGDIYDSVNDVFYKPKPYPSWVLNQSTWQWESPIPNPNKRGEYQRYTWNESTTSWTEVQQGA
jgi:hypothetical protein